MDSVLKRYFWLINLLLLAGIAFLCAKVANNLIAEGIVGIETKKAAVKKKQVDNDDMPLEALDWAERIVGRNIFNSQPPEDKPKLDAGVPSMTDSGIEVAPKEGPPGPTDPCEKSESAISLTATMVADPPEWSMAALDEEGSDRLVKIGLEIDKKKLVAIHRTRIVLQVGSKYECVELGKAKRGRKNRYAKKRSRSSRGSKSKARRKERKNRSKKIKEGVKKRGKNSYQIDRDMLNEQLEDLGKLSRDARVIPHYRGGKPRGFKIVGVRPGSLYSHVGVRSGDILKSVNGEEINSPTKALQLFEKLKNSDSVTLDVERRGRKQTLEYMIK